VSGNSQFDNVPWHDTKKWKKDYWYPMPVGFLSRDNPEYLIDGYQIFALQEDTEGDMDLIVPEVLNFTQALEICEAHNRERLIDVTP